MVKYFLWNTKVRTDAVNAFINKSLNILGMTFQRDTWVVLKRSFVNTKLADRGSELFLLYWIDGLPNKIESKRG